MDIPIRFKTPKNDCIWEKWELRWDILPKTDNWSTDYIIEGVRFEIHKYHEERTLSFKLKMGINSMFEFIAKCIPGCGGVG